jgi:hypothetical protein
MAPIIEVSITVNFIYNFIYSIAIKQIHVAMSDFVLYQLKHGLEYLKC